MRWDAVLKAVGDVAAGQADLHRIYGDAIGLKAQPQGDSKLTVPRLALWLIGDAEEELFAPVTVQWDQWTTTLEDLITSERVLRHLFHARLTVTVAGVEMDCEYVDGDTLATPDRDGFFGRAVRFRHTPLREPYVAPGH